MQSAPPGVADPALQAALAELLQLGLAVARVSARLAEVEGRAVDALAEAALEAARVVVGTPGSLADAIEAGQRADASDAARDAIVARVAAITDSFDKAARAVRRTAALQARLADGRPFRDWSPRGAMAGVARGRDMGARAANDAEWAERGDKPDWGDEIGGRSDEEVVLDICRDLGLAATGESRFGPVAPEVVRAICARAARPRMLRPRIVVAGSEPASQDDAAPEPDT